MEKHMSRRMQRIEERRHKHKIRLLISLGLVVVMIAGAVVCSPPLREWLNKGAEISLAAIAEFMLFGGLEG